MDIKEHPIFEAIYNACLEVEKLPASEQQTKAVTMVGDIESSARKLLESNRMLADVLRKAATHPLCSGMGWYEEARSILGIPNAKVSDSRE